MCIFYACADSLPSRARATSLHAKTNGPFGRPGDQVLIAPGPEE